MKDQQRPSPFVNGVGDRTAQQRFIQRHQKFLQEYPYLAELSGKVFNRTLAVPDGEEYRKLLAANLPHDDPAVVACEDRILASYQIFQFGLGF